jgi:MFS family permease
VSRWTIVSPTSLLIILALINFLNYVDRYVIGALVPFLKDPELGLGLSSAQIGWLSTAFMVVHSVASIPLGYLADRWMRKRLIAAGVGLWSIATALAGLAQTFGQIFVARAAVGIGEATYAPAASALISDRFDAALRARVLGIFQLGMVLGAAIGLVAGGLVAAWLGWREAFLVVGVPGLLLAALILFVYEPDPSTRRRPRPATSGGAWKLTSPREGSWTAAVWITIAGILTTFFTGAIGVWAPEFILRSRFGGDPRFIGDVVTSFGPLVVLAGVTGTLTGSFIADRLERLRPGAGRLYTIAIGVLVSAPCAAIAFLSTGGPAIYVMLGIGVFFNVWYVGPILAALHDVVPARLRATITGAYFFLIHALGDAISPLIVGYIDDWRGSLSDGLLFATALMALAGVAALAAVRASRRLALSRAAPAQ